MDARDSATQDAIAEFTQVNYRVSTLLTQHGGKRVFMQKSINDNIAHRRISDAYWGT